MVNKLRDILLGLEMKRREVKSQSRDGVIVNFIWDRLSENLTGVHGGSHYVGQTREKAKVGKTSEELEVVIPLQTSSIAEDLKWSAREVRSVIHSMQLMRDKGRPTIKAGNRTYRPIFFEPEKLEKLLLDFVSSYKAGQLDMAICHKDTVSRLTRFLSLSVTLLREAGQRLQACQTCQVCP